MRILSSIMAGVAAAALLAAAPAQAALSNPSFESNLDGWTTDEDYAQVVGGMFHRNAMGDVDYSYDPIDGFFLGMLTANAEDKATTISQTFTTGAGTFFGSAAFLGADTFPDFGYVRILDASRTAVFSLGSGDLFAAGIGVNGGLGPYGFTPWTNFSTYLGGGTYTIEAGVTNVGDDLLASRLLIDGFGITVVPEPDTWALMLSGFFALGVALRRRRPQLARVRSRRR